MPIGPTPEEPSVTIADHYQSLHPSELALFHKNPRVGDVEAIAASLRAHGQYAPIIVNVGTHTGRKNEVLKGNHTLKAFRTLAERHPDDQRWQTIECRLLDVDDDQAARIVAVDNRTSELGSFDTDVLLDLLQELPDLEGTGYDDDYLDGLLAETPVPEGETDRDDAPPPPADPVSRPGDVWMLGRHRVLCGDSTDVAAVEAMMDGDLADCVWTDPPYGVDYVGKTKDALTIQNDQATDLDGMLAGAFATIIAVARPGAPVYSAAPQGPLLHDFQSAFVASGIQWRQNLVWVKNSMILGRSDYHYKHEPILYGFTPAGAGTGRLGRGGDRRRVGGGFVGGEEVVPRLVHARRVSEVPLVHLLDDPLVRTEARQRVVLRSLLG